MTIRMVRRWWMMIRLRRDMVGRILTVRIRLRGVLLYRRPVARVSTSGGDCLLMGVVVLLLVRRLSVAVGHWRWGRA